MGLAQSERPGELSAGGAMTRESRTTQSHAPRPQSRDSYGAPGQRAPCGARVWETRVSRTRVVSRNTRLESKLLDFSNLRHDFFLLLGRGGGRLRV